MLDPSVMLMCEIFQGSLNEAWGLCTNKGPLTLDFKKDKVVSDSTVTTSNAIWGHKLQGRWLLLDLFICLFYIYIQNNMNIFKHVINIKHAFNLLFDVW